MAGIDAFGTELRRGVSDVFTAIANVTNISGPTLSRSTLDVTAHDSPGQWMEFLGGLKDAGEVELEVNYDPDVHDSLVADLDDAAPREYQLGFPTTPETVWSFDAILTGFEPEAPHDDKLAASITFKITGAPTLGGS